MSHRILPQPAHELAQINAALPAMAHYSARDIETIAKVHMRAAAAIPAWPSYTGISQLVGTSHSGKVTVYVDPSLGASALANAHDLIANADTIVGANDMIFGSTGGNVNVIIFALGGVTNGQGGADHMACDYVTGQNIEVDADFGEPARVHALFEAELSECSMKGRLCGLSTGEALSRWCAIKVAGNVIKDFQSAAWWLILSGSNFVDVTEPTDRDRYSTGCGMVFLSWLMSQHGGLGVADLPAIAQHMVALGDAGTLADLYAALTGKPKAEAWPHFQGAIAGAGGAYKLAQRGLADDPFNSLGAPVTWVVSHAAVG